MAKDSERRRRHVLLSGEEMRALGDRIAARRRAKWWSQRELGRRAGVQSIRLSRMEKGRITPKLPELLRLIDALGAGLDEIVRGSGPPPRAESRTVLRQLQELEGLAGPGVWAAFESLLQTLVTVFRARPTRREDCDAER